MIAGGRGGSILNISSVRGQLGIDAGYSAYVAAKSAQLGLARVWARELGPEGITVNTVAPGTIRTRVNNVHAVIRGAMRDRYLALDPMDGGAHVDHSPADGST